MAKDCSVLLIMVVLSCCKEAVARERPSDQFNTPAGITLAKAIAEDKVERVSDLIQKGTDVNLRGVGGMTELVWAIHCGSKAAFSCLLDHGASPNLLLEDGTSAVSMAAELEDTWYLSEISKHGGNLDIVNPESGDTPIFSAIRQMRAATVFRLIAAKVNLDFKDKDGFTPLMTAAMLNRYDLVYALLKGGANPEARNANGNSLLWFLKEIRIDANGPMYPWKVKTIGLLRSKGMDVDGSN
jgi:uncharacterized protein